MYHNGSDQEGSFKEIHSHLATQLATSGYGYKIINRSAPISNLFYVENLKLYCKNKQEEVGELKIVKQFGDDIGMEFGLEKCARASF